ncbi:zinc dependent phospholipase C family protein [Methanopyrus sp.]
MPAGPVHLVYGVLLAVMSYPQNPEYGGIIVYASLAPDFATAAYHDQYSDLRYVNYRWAHNPTHVYDYASVIVERTVSRTLQGVDEKAALWCAETGIVSHLFLDLYTHVKTSPIKEWREHAGIETVLREFYYPWEKNAARFARWALGRAIRVFGNPDEFWQYVSRACDVAEQLMGDYVVGAYLRRLSEHYFGDPDLHLVDWLRWFCRKYGWEKNPGDAFVIDGVEIPADPVELLSWISQWDPRVTPTRPPQPSCGGPSCGGQSSFLPVFPVLPVRRR